MKAKELIKKIDWEKMQGLIPVVVQDYKTNQVLMLGFMNNDALRTTLKYGKPTYWSRTRQKLWTKGETSGNFQIVKALFLDCDNDTLLIQVEQKGKVCHTGHRTCFFEKVTHA